MSAEEAVYNFDLGALYTSWLTLIQDDQQRDGGIPVKDSTSCLLVAHQLLLA